METNPLTYKQRFIKNLSLLYLATFISKIFALIINIVLVRKLGASIYGAFGFALTFVTYFTLIADSGLSSYGETTIAKNKSDAKKTAGGIFSFNLFLSLVSVVILLFLSMKVFSFGSVQSNMLLLISFLPLIEIFSFNYVIKALEKNQIMALSVFLGRLIYFMGIIVFITKKSDYFYAVLFFVIGAFLTSIIQFGFVIKLIGKIKLNFSLKNFKYLAINGMPFGIVSALLTLYGSLPILFLKIFSTDKNIGYYYMAGRLIFFVSSFTGLAMGAFIPIMSEAIKNNDFNKQSSIISELLRFNYTFLIPVCFGGVVLSRQIISVFFGSKYLISASLLDIMIWSILFMGVSSVFGGYLTSLQDKKSLILSSLFTFSIGILLVPALIKFYGVYGGAVSVLLIELIVCAASIMFTIRKGRGQNADSRIIIRVDGLNFIRVLSASIIMAFIVWYLNIILRFNPLLDVVLCVIFGILLYFVLSIMLGTLSRKDLMEIKEMLKR